MKSRKISLTLEMIRSIAGRRLFWSLVVLWITCVAFLGLLVKHRKTPRPVTQKTEQTLPYERPKLLGIENEIQEIDALIYHCLLDSGLYSENIKYRVERKKTRGGLSYELCEMIIPIDHHNTAHFFQLLKKRATHEFSNISIRHTQHSGRIPVITISVNNLKTHRLIFRQSAPFFAEKVSGKRPKIAIVIDDFGPVYRQAKEFLKIKVPITFSVLPFRRHSREIAKLVHDRGYEVMLHLPMEPYGYPAINPGDGALLLKMSDDEIVATTNKCLSSLNPFISGVNNHMGSAFTENQNKMQTVLIEIKKKNLFFLDSLTSPHSKAYQTACSLHIPALRRDIFLDVKQTKEFINGQLKKLISIARKRGSAIAIGHPYNITLKVLRKRLPEINRKQVQIVPVSELIK